MRNTTHTVILALSVVVGLARPARAAGTFTVTTTADAGPGSLRQAMVDANSANGGTINVTTGGLVLLESALPVVATPVTLNGNNLLVSGNDLYRVLFVDAPAGAPVAINNLAILRGR